MKKTIEFTRPEGHDDCQISTGIHECLTFGSGKLDPYGYWEYSCDECAREHERQFPEDGACWPHTQAYLDATAWLPSRF